MGVSRKATYSGLAKSKPTATAVKSPTEETQRFESRWACSVFECTWEDIQHIRMEVGLRFIRRRFPKDYHHKGVIRCKAFWVWWNECWAKHELDMREIYTYRSTASIKNMEWHLDRYADSHLEIMRKEVMPTPLLAAINYSVKLHYPKS